MGYPGNPELSAQAQERVLSAFRQVVSKLQDGQRENALIGLEFVLRLDPTFGPALNLQRQLASGSSEIDLSDIMVQLEAPTSEAISTSLVDAVDAFNNRDFMTAKAYAEKVLIEEPGHAEAKQLLAQVQDALKVETQVNYFLGQARQALDSGDAQEASNFVLMAQALDPHHGDIARALDDIERSAGGIAAGDPAATQRGGLDGDGISFQTIDESPQGFDGEASGFGGPVAEGFGSAGQGFGDPSESPPEATEGFGSSAFGQEPQADRCGMRRPTVVVPRRGTPPSRPRRPPPGPMPPLPGPASGGAPGGDFASPAGDVADLFKSEAPQPAAQAPPVAVSRPDDDISVKEERAIQTLLDAGRSALATEDYREAIHHLSRIVLIDAHHHEATTRLAEAREAQAAIDEKVEQLIFDAQEAAMGGEDHRLTELLTAIRNLDPSSIEAHDLQQRLSEARGAPTETTAQAELPAAPTMPDLDDDLFSEDLGFDGPAGDASSPAMDLAGSSAPATSGRRALPLKKIGLAVAGVVVVVAALAVGSMLFSPGDDSDMGDRAVLVSNLLRQADDLMKQGTG
jgi:hypothetical protein